MSKEYAIAEARRHLADIVDQAESGIEVRLTRRGRPVAVVVSMKRYESLRQPRTSFARAYREFRKKFPEGAFGIEPSYFRSLRDRSGGRRPGSPAREP